MAPVIVKWSRAVVPCGQSGRINSQGNRSWASCLRPRAVMAGAVRAAAPAACLGTEGCRSADVDSALSLLIALLRYQMSELSFESYIFSIL